MKQTNKEDNRTEVIVLKQKPIISYDLVESKGKEVAERIASLNLESIEPTEDNLKLLKNTRTELKKEFDIFESQRKMVKDMVMKPYNDFDESYKKNISSLFKDADMQLKGKIGVVDTDILNIKIDSIKDYFNEVNTYGFISFEDLELKIIKSISDKKIQEQITEYLHQVSSNIDTISTLDNKDRVLAKYQIHKDLNRAISETQQEVKREADLKAQEEAREKARIDFENKQKEYQNQAQQDINNEVELHETGIIPPVNSEPTHDETQQVKANFTVIATMAKIRELKSFMDEKGIRYE